MQHCSKKDHIDKRDEKLWFADNSEPHWHHLKSGVD